MGYANDKGYAAEAAVVKFLRDNGFPHAERRVAGASADRGDITGLPALCVEVKAAARYEIGGWLVETTTEAGNARANHGLLVVKPKGVGYTRVGDWWAVMRLADMTRLLREAGYGDPLLGGAA